MPLPIQVQRNIKIRDHNRYMMGKMLRMSTTRINTQGDGCFIDDYGVSYCDQVTKKRDSIAILTGLPDRYFRYFFRVITDESMKPVVRHLERNFNIDVSRECEREIFKKFLQALQDAHDIAFTSKGHMSAFRDLCAEIQKEFKL